MARAISGCELWRQALLLYEGLLEVASYCYAYDHVETNTAACYDSKGNEICRISTNVLLTH